MWFDARLYWTIPRQNSEVVIMSGPEGGSMLVKNSLLFCQKPLWPSSLRRFKLFAICGQGGGGLNYHVNPSVLCTHIVISVLYCRHYGGNKRAALTLLRLLRVRLSLDVSDTKKTQNMAYCSRVAIPWQANNRIKVNKCTREPRRKCLQLHRNRMSYCPTDDRSKKESFMKLRIGLLVKKGILYFTYT